MRRAASADRREGLQIRCVVVVPAHRLVVDRRRVRHDLTVRLQIDRGFVEILRQFDEVTQVIGAQAAQNAAQRLVENEARAIQVLLDGLADLPGPDDGLAGRRDQYLGVQVPVELEPLDFSASRAPRHPCA